MAADADFVLSALLVAVIVNVPAELEENVAPVAVGPASVPPVVLHVTPAAPTSFVTVAVNGKVCAVVMPPRFGLIVTPMLPGSGSGGAPPPPHPLNTAALQAANNATSSALRILLYAAPLFIRVLR